MSPDLNPRSFAIFLMVVIVFVVWWEIGLWNECRETNSFWYCLRILNH